MAVTARQECGYMGIKQPECESKGCCWKPLQKGSKAPWCYKPGNQTKNKNNSCCINKLVNTVNDL